MKVRGGRGREAFKLVVPTDSTAAAVLEDSDSKLKEDVLGFMQKGRVVLLGDPNARVGSSTDVEDITGMLGEETWNAIGNRLISFLNEEDLVICNGRKLVSEPEATRIRPGREQKLVIHYIVTDLQLMRESGDLQVDTTDIGSLTWIIS